MASQKVCNYFMKTYSWKVFYLYRKQRIKMFISTITSLFLFCIFPGGALVLESDLILRINNTEEQLAERRGK